VLTTIQPPTPSTEALNAALRNTGDEMIVIGDKRGPFEYCLPNVQFYSLEGQLALSFQLAQILPTGHYARKNIGYIIAIRQGADCIYETDDDNAPDERWRRRNPETQARRAQTGEWANVYRMFSDENIWPRGFPLELISDPSTYSSVDETVVTIEAPIQQGLADISPDVDALWRLTMDREFRFNNLKSVLVQPGTWCPFNSQTTWWWPAAYPLLYLPSYCSFRMTDIWRSFIAQRCLWELGQGIVFHSPEVCQVRNLHNLMRDFADEIPGYLHNRKITGALSSLSLRSGVDAVASNLRVCYEELVRIDILPEKELTLVEAWLNDISA
jgi:hypothetical protein